MQYQIISVGDRPRRGFPPATLPELIWVDVSDLRLDPAYQRPIESHGWRHIQRIADDFDWGRFSPLIVAPLPEGGYAVIDGQHRAHAAALRMIERLPALSVSLDQRGQARAFAAINGSVTRVSPLNLFRAALTAGEDWALESRTAVEQAGCRLMTYNAASRFKKPFQIYSVGFVRTHVTAGRGPVITRALSSIRRLEAAQTSVTYWQDTILRPWVAVCARYPSLSADSLAELARQADLPKIQDRANQMLSEPSGRGKSHMSLMTDILMAMTANWIATGDVRRPAGPRAA